MVSWGTRGCLHRTGTCPVYRPIYETVSALSSGWCSCFELRACVTTRTTARVDAHSYIAHERHTTMHNPRPQDRHPRTLKACQGNSPDLASPHWSLSLSHSRAHTHTHTHTYTHTDLPRVEDVAVRVEIRGVEVHLGRPRLHEVGLRADSTQIAVVPVAAITSSRVSSSVPPLQQSGRLGTPRT